MQLESGFDCQNSSDRNFLAVKSISFSIFKSFDVILHFFNFIFFPKLFRPAEIQVREIKINM